MVIALLQNPSCLIICFTLSLAAIDVNTVISGVPFPPVDKQPIRRQRQQASLFFINMQVTLPELVHDLTLAGSICNPGVPSSAYSALFIFEGGLFKLGFANRVLYYAVDNL